MSEILLSTLQKYTQYISRGEILRRYPLRPSFMYKTVQSFSSFRYHQKVLALPSEHRIAILRVFEFIDKYFYTDCCAGLIIEYKGRPLLYLENFEVKPHSFRYLLFVNFSGLLDELEVHKKVAEFEIRMLKRISTWSLAATFIGLALLTDYIRLTF